MKPITGQYECEHRSGVGLDYFTSRIDRLTLYPNGRFLLTVQDRSRIANAAQSFLQGQQISHSVPETRYEGSYTQQEKLVSMQFDNGRQEQAQLSWNGEGLQIGKNYFQKVSDSTMLPPTHRVQKDMNDIAKGLKIAGTVGSFALKAAKTIQKTVQTVQENPAPQQPNQPPSPAPNTSPQTPPPTPQARPQGAIFCEMCGARCRPGKRFCNQCGAMLY
uniref:Zinc ribbon domain-containing protein n=1 Tax=Thermosporothrix sp. COM3 TaxID=2490863 RepID=A0A455SZ47_9CHLR|nr:hypothetical protein KTC_61360 [Thermosporothrix sp. COM3]